MISDFFQKDKISLYQPSPEIQKTTQYAKEVYSIGHQILTKAWPELNDMSVIGRDNRDKKTFNAYVDENVVDPKEAWKWRGTRSTARKQALGMHAHLTAGFMFPMVSAQDENNNEDRGVGDFMRDMLIWMGDNSDYRSSFLQMAMGLLTSPVTYLGAEYATIMQKSKEKLDKGYTIKEVLDEELSGFRAPVYGSGDVLITNAYVQNIQKQTCVIKQRYLDYSDAQKKYGEHDNWDFVQRGINSVLNEDDGLFYDVYDPDNANLVKETICMWRGEDLEIPFLGGVYMGDENVEWNPMKHRDNFGTPKYDVIPFGFHRISEHFFYYKSLMNSLGWDDQLIDAMYENYMNGEFMFRNPPVAITGEDNVDTSVMFPGAQFVTANKDTKVQSILPQRQDNMAQAIQMVEDSIKEGALSDTQMGQLPEASQKAYSVAKSDQIAKILLKGVGQSLGESIVQYGKLMVDIAINHLSTPIIEEISANAQRMKYRQFVLPKQASKGKNITKILRYGEDLIGRKMSKQQRIEYNLKLYQEAGDDKTIMVMNPELASRMRLLIRIDPEEMFAENKEYTQRLLSQMYSLLRQDPMIDAETMVRKLMNSFFRSEGDELMADKSVIEKIAQQAEISKAPKGLPEEISRMRPLTMSAVGA